MSDTPKLGLPEISESQSAKYLTHNDALRRLDILVQASAIDKDLTAPPGSPADGDTYIVGATNSTSGDWEDHDDNIAFYESGAWVFLTPNEGWHFWLCDENLDYVYKSASLGWVAEAD